MKKIRVKVSTSMVGSEDTTDFELPDDATPEEIKNAAFEAMFEMIEWDYTVDGEQVQ